MTDQLYINDRGDLEEQPRTWDGEPLYSQETVNERLFETGAFEQQPGQLAIEDPCEDCGAPATCERWDMRLCEHCHYCRLGRP